MKTKPLIFNVITLMLLTGYIHSVKAQDQANNSNQLNIEVKQIDAQKALVIRADVPTSEVGPKMGEIYGMLFGYIGQNQIDAVGPPFAVYYSFDPQGNTVFEAGVPIDTIAPEYGEIKYKEFEAMKVASTLYTGPYEKMEPVYAAIQKYIKDNKLKEKGTSWEVYLTDPSEAPDPTKYQTLIYYPVE